MSLDIVSLIDEEIARLTKARALLEAAGRVDQKRIKASVEKKAPKTKKKRTLSPEARKRIADAQHKRWAAQKSKSRSK